MARYPSDLTKLTLDEIEELVDRINREVDTERNIARLIFLKGYVTRIRSEMDARAFAEQRVQLMKQMLHSGS